MAALTLFLALVLAVSAGHKLVERERMAVAAARLTGLPASNGALASLGAAMIEAMAALCLLAPPAQAVGAALAATLWLAYGIALARLHGQVLDCGCSFASREKPVGGFMLGRAFGLSALAGLSAILAPAPLDWAAPFAALAFLTLYFAANELAGIIIYRKGHAA